MAHGGMQRDDDLGATLLEIGHSGATVERPIRDRRCEAQSYQQRRDTTRVVALAGMNWNRTRLPSASAGARRGGWGNSDRAISGVSA